MKFSNIYTFFRFDQGKVCLCMCKVKATGQETGLESKLASQTSIFKIVLAALLNPSFNKCYMRLFSKKQKKLCIFVTYFSQKKENNSTGYKGPCRIQA